jgi:hypothetical protein
MDLHIKRDFLNKKRELTTILAKEISKTMKKVIVP